MPEFDLIHSNYSSCKLPLLSALFVRHSQLGDLHGFQKLNSTLVLLFHYNISALYNNGQKIKEVTIAVNFGT